jgi:hypothetical protein
MPICLFAASVFLVVIVARKKQIRMLSPFGIFMVFQVLYNLTPWLAASSGSGPGLLSLLYDRALVNIQLVLASVSNICFALVFLIFYRDVKFTQLPPLSSNRVRRNYLLLACLFFLVTCALCERYGWHQLLSAGNSADDGQTLGGMFTVAAYFKFFSVAIYLYYLYRFGLDRGAWFLLGQQAIVMVVDGARTTFLPIFLVTMFIYLDKGIERKRLRAIYILALGGFILSIGTRSLILRNESVLQDLVTPVLIEGSMGSYVCLQSIQGVKALPHPPYTLGSTYIIDPIVWLLPQSMGREDLLSFKEWSDKVSPTLNERFAPMGGFYYLSEAVAAYSYVGPAIVTTIFAFSMIWIDRHKNTHRILYLAWMPTVGLLFVKVVFGNGVKIFVITILSMHVLHFFSRLSVSHRRVE